jgi:hypothetical protein
VRQTFTGSWDDSGIMVPFFRPLTIAWYALRFELFGLNSEAHHIVSLSLFVLAALLAAAFAFSATRSRLLPFTVIVAFITHPAMPYAQVAWITNQMHLLASLLVLGGLVWAQHAAGRGLAWWLPLLLIATAAFMVKEDCIMLLPAVIVIHWLRRRIVDRTLPPVPIAFVGLAVVLVAALVLYRQDALGGMGGYGRPTAEQAWSNFSRGLRGVFSLAPAHRPWQGVASWFATLLPFAALLAARRASRGTVFTMAAGFAAAVLFNAPFALVTKSEQMHLVALGASLVFGGSAGALIQAARGRLLKAAAALVLAAGFAACAAVSRHITTDFAPFGPIVRSHDEIVLGWGAVPDELRDYVKRKGAPGAAERLSPNPQRELRLAGFGFHNYETSPDGVRYRWMRLPHAVIHVMPGAQSLVIPLRHERGAFGEPARVSISVNGRVVDRMVLDDGTWRYSTVPLRGQLPRFARTHEVAIEIPRVWVPADVIPGSADPRPLGLQVGVPVVR